MIGPTSTVIQKASDFVGLDIAAQANPLNPKATPGYRYQLPQIERLAPLSAVVFHASSVGGGMGIADLAMWTLTLVQPDGHELIRDFPCALLSDAQRQLHYFDYPFIIDPLQSYMRTADINASKLIARFSLLY